MLDDNCKQPYGPYIAFAFIIVLLVGATLASYSRSPLPPPNKEQQHHPETTPTAQQSGDNERGTPGNPLVVEVHEAAPSPEIAAQHAEDREARASAERWIVGGTVMIAIFTAVLAVATIGLIVVGFIQIKFLIRAEIATKRATVLANRPWVFTHPWRTTAEKVGEQIFFQMYLRCYGNGPATVTQIGIICSDVAPTKDTPFEIVALEGRIEGTNIGLAPDNQWLYPEVRNDFYNTPMNRPFVFGYVRYRDQFAVHTSRFTVKLSVNPDGKINMVTAGDPAWSRFDESIEEK